MCIVNRQNLKDTDMTEWRIKEWLTKPSHPIWRRHWKIVPGDPISQTCLEQQVSVWQQVVTDEVLIGPHRHTMAHTQRAQHLQHLEHNLSALHPTTASLNTWKLSYIREHIKNCYYWHHTCFCMSATLKAYFPNHAAGISGRFWDDIYEIIMDELFPLKI